MSRTTIEFNSGADEQLERLTESLDIKSKAEVVRNALSLYDYVVKQLQEKPEISLGFIDESDDNRIDRVILVPGIYRPVAARSTAATVARAREYPVGAGR